MRKRLMAVGMSICMVFGMAGAVSAAEAQHEENVPVKDIAVDEESLAIEVDEENSDYLDLKTELSEPETEDDFDKKAESIIEELSDNPEEPDAAEYQETTQREESGENVGLLDGGEVIESGTCGEKLTWTLTSEGVLTISGTGEMEDYSWDFDSPFANKDNIKSIVIDHGVTSIGKLVFVECTSLTGITLPDSVTSIGEWAFYYCTSLTSITIPDSVTNIGDSAFCNCDSLTSITIPDSVTSIGEQVFSSCDSLTSIMIPDSVTSIGDYAFTGCSSLTSITIPDSVTSIGYEAFSRCSSLTSITIPDSVTSIGNYAFHGCPSRESIQVGSNNKSYDSRNNCNAIIETSSNKLILGCKNTVIPEDVTSIGYSAFSRCDGLTSITIPDSVTSISEWAFSSCENLTSITIPDSVTSIGEEVFYYCSSLTSITIPDSVTSIGYQAFYGCSSLTSITIPDSATSIGSRAFSECSSLTGITIPDSVTKIDYQAFYGCTSLKDIYFTGSEDQWNEACASYKMSGKYDSDLANVTIHYDYSIPCEHKWDNGVITTPATCEKEGVRTYTCSLCGETKTESIPKSAHNLAVIAAKPASFTEAGNEAYYKCKVCNKLFSDSAGKKELAKIPVIAKLKAQDIGKATVSGLSARKYTGKALKPALTVKLGSVILKEGIDYTVKYSSNTKVGTATVTITGKGNYTGNVKVSFKITKAANPIKIKVASKTYSRNKLKKAVSFKIGTTKAQGKVTYTLSSAAKKAKIKVSASGKVTVPKKCKKGTYKITVKAAGNKNYKAGKKTVTIKVK